MALLGTYGTVSFRREWAQPAAVNNSRLISGSQGNSLDLSDPAFWSGDGVLLLCDRGVPVGLSGAPQDDCCLVAPPLDSYAPCPGGHAFYGEGQFDSGPVGRSRHKFNSAYIGSGNAPFYDNLPTTTSAYVYIHRDEMDNVTFYSDQDDAINGKGDSLLPISILDVGALVISPAPEGNYTQSLINQILSYATPLIFSRSMGEVSGDQFLPKALSQEIADFIEESSETSGWKQVANLTSWVFETNVDVLDQNAIGQRFGDSAKGSLKGAGSFNAIVDSKEAKENFGPSSLLRLMLVTQVGAKANAKFVIADAGNSGSDCGNDKTIYYETPIIISSSSVNASVAEVITMTLQFVATGKIKLISTTGG